MAALVIEDHLSLSFLVFLNIILIFPWQFLFLLYWLRGNIQIRKSLGITVLRYLIINIILVAFLILLSLIRLFQHHYRHSKIIMIFTGSLFYIILTRHLVLMFNIYHFWHRRNRYQPTFLQMCLISATIHAIW